MKDKVLLNYLVRSTCGGAVRSKTFPSRRYQGQELRCHLSVVRFWVDLAALLGAAGAEGSKGLYLS